jgi:hypothetical protein
VPKLSKNWVTFPSKKSREYTLSGFSVVTRNQRDRQTWWNQWVQF